MEIKLTENDQIFVSELMESVKRVHHLATILLNCDCEDDCDFKLCGSGIIKALNGEQ